jgi:uncharacterized protein
MATQESSPLQTSIPWWLGYLHWPKTILAFTVLLLLVSAYYMSLFRFDASSETLVVEGDPDLALYERVADTFGGDEFLFLTFKPNNQKPISSASLAVLEEIVDDLEAVDGVAGVFSILDAPLLKSPPMSLAQLADGFRTLRSEDVDFELAREELTNSPFFRELLITVDGSASAIKIDLAPAQTLLDITAQRQALRQTGQDSGARWDELNNQYRVVREKYLAEREAFIANIRKVQDKYADEGVLHLGGVPMIAADMITYVKSDLQVFGRACAVFPQCALGGATAVNRRGRRRLLRGIVRFSRLAGHRSIVELHFSAWYNNSFADHSFDCSLS